MQQPIELTLVLDRLVRRSLTHISLTDSAGNSWVLITKDELDRKLTRALIYSKKLRRETSEE